ncbi:MAG: hypothetical protein ACLSE6_05125 [Alphaproteobacteria bacterium]
MTCAVACLPICSQNRRRTDDRSPKTIRPDILAAEAVNLMNGKGITQLLSPKTISGRYIHLHDCLRAGLPDLFDSHKIDAI